MLRELRDGVSPLEMYSAGKLAFGGDEGDGYFFRGMMWTDTCWFLRDDKEEVARMEVDIIEELMNLDMEPKLES